MVYSYNYTPKYYSTFQDSITSLCKTILPFSFKKRSLPSAEYKLSKLQSDNLKWQQNSFHQVLNLMGLHKEGIVAENEVSAFRTHLLDTLIASPNEQEHPLILRDKLLFLQELLYAKCISEEDYHSSKRPLLQRLAVQGAQIEAKDVIMARTKDSKESSEEEWSVIDLKDEKCLVQKENSNSKNKSNQGSNMKHIKGTASVFGFDSTCLSKTNEQQSEGSSILMEESGPPQPLKRKPFRTLFHREQIEGHGGGDGGCEADQRASKSVKRWGFDGFKKWKKNDLDDEIANEAYLASSQSFARAPGEGPDTKLIKKKLHSDGSPSDFFIDKVLGDKIKKELSRIQTELSSTNPNLKFSNDQIEAISTKIPVDKAELKNYFPKSWCDRYGDVVLDVVKKEFKEHVGEMENMRNIAREKHGSSSRRWATSEDDENIHPNLFANHDYSVHSSNINPFSNGYSKWN
ncbi:PREDICTED: uncharacterized protein LOC109354841 isoform X2 [Lupinus angustifolius]|uniref:uncharacterized protein LOC109354841 isoform X2 n=1 Tax=Lupinus angustifolius TaxID=3871 RepID=UPI00092F412C|nr:PREDICTED: uncharacterized protein LOC109354841 isoform X2 [Lupinus angustifolius]